MTKKGKMIKEQIVILKVKYNENYDQTPHTWNWTEIVKNNHEIEVLNHGSPEESK